MSTPVTYVGNIYNVPAYNDTGYAQGSGNLSSYLIALATGSLTLSGGSFPLTADADFGTSFGLVAKYLKSTAATVSSTGVIRLGNTDVIGWRNFLGSGDNQLGTDTSDRLTYNGVIFPSFSGGDITLTTAGKGLVVTTPDGTKTFRIAISNDGEVTTEELT